MMGFVVGHLGHMLGDYPNSYESIALKVRYKIVFLKKLFHSTRKSLLFNYVLHK
jgi:hypothetical protein